MGKGKDRRHRDSVLYDPDTNVFAALGHGIYESKTETLLEAGDGKLFEN